MIPRLKITYKKEIIPSLMEKFDFKNASKTAISDYTIEVLYPKYSINSGVIQDEFNVVSIDVKGKLFPNQTKFIDLESITIRNDNANEILNKKIVVRIYSDLPMVEKVFRLSDILLVHDKGHNIALTVDHFHDKNFR